MENEKEVVIVGAGGFAREMFLHISRYNENKAEEEPFYRCIGFLSDYGNELDGLKNYPPVIDKIHGHVPDPDRVYILGIGEPKYRWQIANLFRKDEALFVPFLNRPSFYKGINKVRKFVDNNVETGSGSIVITSGTTVNIKIGKFVLINGCYSIGHDVKIGDYCEIGPLCVVGGRVTFEEGVHLGPGVIVGTNVKIGAWSKISAGSVVLNDVPPCSYVASPQCKVYRDFFLPHDEQK